MAKVSVIIPMYNSEKYIKNTINSVIEQTFNDWELIVVDDGSSDNSIEVAKSFNDERIRLIESLNGGASSARNIGIDNASGEYITFLDSDDLYDRNYLEKLFRFNNYDLVVCGIKRIINDKTEAFCAEFTYNNIPNNILDIIQSGMLNSPVNKLYKKAIIDKYHLKFDISMEIGEDYNFNFRYLEYCESIKCINDLLYLYLIRNNSISSKKIDDVLNKRKINIDLTEKYLRKYNIDLSLVDNMKVKLIYVYLMQDNPSNKEIEDNLYIDYFKNLKNVKGKSYVIMYYIYKLHWIFGLKLFAKMIKILRKHSVKLDKTSM